MEEKCKIDRPIKLFFGLFVFFLWSCGVPEGTDAIVDATRVPLASLIKIRSVKGTIIKEDERENGLKNWDSRKVQKMSFALIYTTLYLLLHAVYADEATPSPEPKITYEGFQVIRISIEDNLALVEGLIDQLELPTWGGALQENRFVDAVIPPENRDEVISTLEGDDVEFVYLHEDLGASIAEQEDYPEYSRMSIH